MGQHIDEMSHHWPCASTSLPRTYGMLLAAVLEPRISRTNGAMHTNRRAGNGGDNGLRTSRVAIDGYCPDICRGL